MTQRALTKSCLLALTTIISSTAASAQVCMPYDTLKDVLFTRYNERVHIRALSNAGHMFELFSSSDNTTWTVVTTSPEGLACLEDDGKHGIIHMMRVQEGEPS